MCKKEARKAAVKKVTKNLTKLIPIYRPRRVESFFVPRIQHSVAPTHVNKHWSHCKLAIMFMIIGAVAKTHEWLPHSCLLIPYQSFQLFMCHFDVVL